jgi:hypothetical protein
MRVAILALMSAGVMVAAAGWIGRDAERGAPGASTTVEIATEERVVTPEPEADAGAAPSTTAGEERDGSSGPSETAAAHATEAAATAPLDVSEEWIPSISEFAEGGVNEARTAPKVAAPIAPDAGNDAARPPPSQLARAVEQDAWRDRIRRMLDVYRRVAPAR